MMSERYNLMVMLLTAYLHTNQDSLLKGGNTLGEFYGNNKEKITGFVDSILHNFRYELSHNQVGLALNYYLSGQGAPLPSDLENIDSEKVLLQRQLFEARKEIKKLMDLTILLLKKFQTLTAFFRRS